MFGVVAASLLLTGAVDAFSFQVTPPQQCGEWEIEWDGGTAPFYLVVVPTTDVKSVQLLNISMPASGSPPYKHSFTLSEPAGIKIIATMYDADGFGSGGATEALTVGDSGDSSCLQGEMPGDFWFWTEPEFNPSQCGTLTFTWQDNATYPVGIQGIVPGGSAFEVAYLSGPVVDRTYNWPVNLKAGTEAIFMMTDAGKYGTGGCTTVLKVQDSSDVSCLNDKSPHHTSAPPLLSPTTSTSSSATPSWTVESLPSITIHRVPAAESSKKSNIGAIVGAAVGVSLAVIIALLIAFFAYRRRRKQNAQSQQPSRASLLGPDSPTPPATETLQAESATPRPSMFNRMALVNRDNSAVTAGLPDGAAPPGVFAHGTNEDNIYVNPFPLSNPPPGAHDSSLNAMAWSDVKVPAPAAAAAMAPLGLHGVNEKKKGDSRYAAPVVRQPAMRAPMGHSSQAQNATASNASTWNLADFPNDPPPQYDMHDQMRVVNADPSGMSSSGASSSGVQSP